MACSCNNWYYNLPCCCPTSDPTTSTTTTQCLNGEPCEESFSSDCVVFQGEGALCYNIVPGQSITDIIKILIDQLPQCTTTTTSTTTTTTEALFSGTLYWGEDSVTACDQSFPIIVTGDGTTFCNSNTFTGTGFSIIGTGTIFISYGGQIKTVNIVSGDSFVTFNGGCDPC